jgi:uncharacterized protein (DUF2236 family)
MEQALHPGAMAGVAKYSDFRDDAWGRLRRTGEYVSLVTYGPREEVDRAAERVRLIHHRLGLDSQEELLWVHTSMVDAFVDVALRSGAPFSEADIDDYLQQMVIFAELVGIERASVPASFEELKSYMIEIQPKLAITEEAKRTSVSPFHLCHFRSALLLLRQRSGHRWQRLQQQRFPAGLEICTAGRHFPVRSFSLIVR